MAHLRLHNVSLKYPIYNTHARSLRSRIVSVATGGIARAARARMVEIEALRGINLELRDGDRLGLIGPNGSGKSTLLKVLAGLYQPTEGAIDRGGHTETLFDLSLLDMDASGADNIRLLITVRGIARDQRDALTARIAEFSELEDYLDLPVRTYSSGMLARLGFSVATAIEPEILLVDEVLGAGDQYFLKKAVKRIEEISQRSRILVLASHSLEMMRQFCNRGVVMRRGQILDSGPIRDVIGKYGL
jgi:ABC-2 type transport system ATP-binding protein/lipopolysaccharide transport system ATP-binding protein